MFRRLANFFRGLFGSALGDLEMSKPEALLEREKENLRKQVQSYNQGLAAHAAMVEKLIVQVERQETEEKDLLTRASANMKAGNNELAAEQAMRLKQVRGELEANREQLEAAEKTYKEMTSAREAAIAEARRKIEAIQAKISQLRVQRATADLNEMAAGMTTEMGSAGETLSRLEEMVDDARAKAAGRARVAKDALPASADLPSQAEHKALATEALRELAGELGYATADRETGDSIPLVIIDKEKEKQPERA
ncbi:MAG: PspA/IM30 family protein [Opitutales bacterium]